jgi:aldehyde:ferredoxin oxidoreductase
VAIEPEFAAMVPEGFSIHTTIVPLSAGTIESEQKMLEDYYEFSGWDKEGIPTRVKLEESDWGMLQNRSGPNENKDDK